MKNSLGLAMIVRDEDTELENLFKTIKGVFDEVVIVVNNNKNPKTIPICRLFTDNVYIINIKSHPDLFIRTGDLVDPNYQHLREYSYSLVKSNLICYLDADDSLINSGEFRQTIVNAFSDPLVNVMELPYHYDHDEYGNCVMVHWISRVIRKGTFTWKGVVHECLLPTQDFKKCRAENVYIRHAVDPDRVRRSATRNFRLSKFQYEREHHTGDIDPRTTLYYARSLSAVGLFKESVPVFEEFLDMSEWDDERYLVLCGLSDLHVRSRQMHKALDYARTAMTLRPLYGQAYFEMAKSYFRMERWEEVVHLVNIGFNSKMPSDLIPTDPSEYEMKPYILLEFALFNMGRALEALGVCKEGLKKQPKNEHLLEREKAIKGYVTRIELEKSALTLLKWLSRDGEIGKLEDFHRSLPEVVKDHPDFVRLNNGFLKARGVSNQIQIYCGPTFETWDPRDIKTKGLGGSEEAVVYLSKELTKLGWLVEVYNNCTTPGIYDGVEYKNFWTHDPKKHCDVFIAWRNSEYVTQAPKDSTAYIWLHDRQKPDYWTPERVARTRRIIVLSKYHRQDLLDIPDEKFFISSNGIIPSHFAGVSQLNRDYLKCFYASSPDRGLDVLLSDIWPKIIKGVPDAHLHIFYGFSKTYDMLHRDRANMFKFKEDIMKLTEQKGVYYHGKVPHAELHEHMMTSGLWLYPTSFTEISCITAMKAQAAGAIPVTMTLAALDETVQYGYKLAFGIQDTRSRKAFINITVDLLKSPKKQEKVRTGMMSWALQKFDWKNVAKEWTDLFRSQDAKVLSG